ncbi:MAG: hypothetical protein WC436_01800 [Candidatus Babeliales bacterium]
MFNIFKKNLIKIFAICLSLFLSNNCCLLADVAIENNCDQNLDIFNINNDQKSTDSGNDIIIDDAINSLKNFLDLLNKNLIKEEGIIFLDLNKILDNISAELMTKEGTNVIFADNFLIKAFLKLSNAAENINSLEIINKKIKFRNIREVLKCTNEISQIIDKENDKENKMLSMSDSLIYNIKQFNESLRAFLINNLANNKFKLDNSFSAKLADIVWYRPVEFIKDHQKGAILTVSGIGTALFGCIGGYYFWTPKKEVKDPNSDDSEKTKNNKDINQDVIIINNTEKSKESEENKNNGDINQDVIIINNTDINNTEQSKKYNETVGHNLRYKKHRNVENL